MTMEITKSLQALRNLDHIKVQSQFCAVVEEVGDLFLLNRFALDPGQQIYDFVRTHVKTRADYVLFLNAVVGIVDYSAFMKMKLSDEDADPMAIDMVRFISDLIAEIEKVGSTFEKPQTTSQDLKAAAAKIRQRYEVLDKVLTDAVTKHLQMNWTGFMITDMITMAQLEHLTVKEYLGPDSAYELSAIGGYVRRVIKKYFETGAKLTRPQVSPEAIWDHLTFLTDLHRESVLVPKALKDIEAAFAELSKKYHPIGKVLLAPFDTQCSSSTNALRELLGLGRI